MPEDSVLKLYGSASHDPYDRNIDDPPVPKSVQDISASVKEVHVLGLSGDIEVLLDELGASRTLEKIVFFACNFRIEESNYRSGILKLKLRAESLEFWRCNDPILALIYLAQPVVRNVRLWCCYGRVLPEKFYFSKECLHRSSLFRNFSEHREFWAGLERLDVIDLWAYDEKRFNFSEMLDILCSSLKVLNIIILGSGAVTMFSDPGDVAPLSSLRVWVGDGRDMEMIEKLAGSAMVASDTRRIDLSPPDLDAIRDDLYREMQFIRDLDCARSSAVESAVPVSRNSKYLSQAAINSKTDGYRKANAHTMVNLKKFAYDVFGKFIYM